MKGLASKPGDLRPHCPGSCDRPARAPAISRITDQRVADMREVNPDLMSSPRRKATFNKCCMSFERVLDAIARQRRFSLSLPEHRHLFAVGWAAADGTGDLPRRRDWYAPHKGGIGPLDPACRKSTRERLVRRLGFGHDHQAAGIFIKPMHDPRPPHAANSRQLRAAMSEQGVDKGSVRISGSGVDDHPGGLVDDDQVCILKADIERDQLSR